MVVHGMEFAPSHQQIVPNLNRDVEKSPILGCFTRVNEAHRAHARWFHFGGKTALQDETGCPRFEGTSKGIEL